MHRVAITGIGVISPVGNSIDELNQAIRSGRCGIGPATSFDTEKVGVFVAGEVTGFDATKYLSKREQRKLDRFTQFAYTAAMDAFKQSGLEETGFDPWRAGIVLGSGMGGLSTVLSEYDELLKYGPKGISPMFVPKSIINAAVGQISMALGLKGGGYGVVTACASSTDAVGQAFRLVRTGVLDIALAGGAESVLTEMAVAGFNNMGALSTQRDPRLACRPFDEERDGFVMGEGAGFLTLENRERALARGAKILGEIAGYGQTSDAYHITAPDPTGISAAMAMTLAMKDGGVEPEDVGYINAHGTSTEYNDKTETLSIRTSFGEAADDVLVSSTKSMTGHLLGATGAVEAIFTVLSLQSGLFPATLGLAHVDAECRLNHIIGKARSASVRYALSNSFGFGGHNSSLLILKAGEDLTC
jgi:3-oxoacyl-[acyl-carrier-protein] synthase II